MFLIQYYKTDTFNVIQVLFKWVEHYGRYASFDLSRAFALIKKQNDGVIAF